MSSANSSPFWNRPRLLLLGAVLILSAVLVAFGSRMSPTRMRPTPTAARPPSAPKPAPPELERAARQLPEPLSLVRDSGDTWRLARGSALPLVWDAPPAAKVPYVGSVDPVSYSNYSSRSDDCFSCRHVQVVVLNASPLANWCGQLIVKDLRNIQQIERIDFRPHGHPAPEPQRAPDLFVLVDALEFDPDPSVPWPRGQQRGEIRINACNQLGVSNETVRTALSRRLVKFQQVASTKFDIQFDGPDKQAVEIELSRQITKDIGESLKKSIEELVAKYRPLPDLPAEFYPPYNAIKLPKLDDLGFLTEQATQHGFMTANETQWRFVTNVDHAHLPGGQVIRLVEKRLAAEGWEPENKKIEDTSSRQWFKRGDQHLVMFNEANARGELATFRNGKVVPPESWILYAEEREDGATIQLGVDQLARSGAPPWTLLLFANHWSKEQHERLTEYCRENAGLDPRVYSYLVFRYHQRGNTALAQEMLRRLAAASWLVTPNKEQSQEFDDRTKEYQTKLGVKELPKHPSAELLRAMGLRELTLGKPPLKVFFRPGEQVGFFTVGPDKAPHTMVLENCSRPGDESHFAAVRYLNRGDGAIYSNLTPGRRESVAMGILAAKAELTAQISKADSSGATLVTAELVPSPRYSPAPPKSPPSTPRTP